MGRRDELPRPIRDVIEIPEPERATHERWRAIESRLEDGVRSGARPPRSVWARTAALGAAAALGVLGLVMLADGPAPLTLRDGATLGAALAGPGTRSVPLSDGSTIRLSEDARMRVLDNRGERLITLLEHGGARFEVEPGTGRAWIVEAGLATVEVTGTVFEVTRDARSVRVSVERGRVLVRGDGVPDRVQALGAGQSIEVHAATDGHVEETIAGERDEDRRDEGPSPGREATEGSASGPRAIGAEHGAANSEVVRRGPSRAIAAPGPPLEPSGTPPGEPAAHDAEALLSRADEARRTGHVDDALALLARAAEGGGEAGAIASLTRGRILLQSGRAREAVLDLERARAGALPRTAREVALSLLVTAYAQSGDPRADAARAEYRALFPTGRLVDGAPPGAAP